ncbi:hypothetical protein [Azospirillum isscasi]|uniref:Uncharacterized protein n=1 Tax=Azospirillum isscasi TaxID=3053926 RepID=A0ABU0WME7_9PROT|nr:hypothetical protein [Azospirillum isscasi]MDQ2105410.1 hypothetical protein [Azospirillum isscasi]
MSRILVVGLSSPGAAILATVLAPGVIGSLFGSIQMRKGENAALRK